MAKPTQQEIDEFNARMNEPDEPDPDDFEVVLFDEGGNPVGTMPFAKAKAYFRKRGIDLDDDGSMSPAGGNAATPAGNAGNGGQTPATPQAPSSRTTSKYFAGKSARGAAVQPAGTGIDPSISADPAGNPVR
jgi:hypothetical protein